MSQARVRWQVLIDWAGNGSFTADPSYLDLYDDVTDRVLRDVGISLDMGRDTNQGTGQAMVPAGALTLGNWDRRFSAESGPLSQNLIPGRAAVIKGSFGNEITMDDPTATMDDYVVLMDGLQPTTLFTGTIEEPTQNPRLGQRSVGIRLLGSLLKLRGQRITTDVYEDITTGEAVQVVFEAAGLTSDEYDIDADAISNGRTLLYWWLDDQDAFDAVVSLLHTEGYPAAFFESPEGKAVFQGRNYRTLNPNSNTSRVMFRDYYDGEVAYDEYTILSDLPALFFTDLRYVSGVRDIVNRAALDIAPRTPAALAPVWTYSGSVTLNASGAGSVIAKLTDPVINAVCSLAGGDFALSVGTVTVTLSRTSGTTIRITFSGGTAGAVISALRLRAETLVAGGSVTIENGIDASESIAKYGTRTYNPPARNEISVGDAQALCDSTVLAYQDARPQVEIDVPMADDTHARWMADLKVSDRITIIETHTGIAADFHINRIRHSIRSSTGYTVTYGCEKVSSDEWAIWGTSVWGTGVWGA